MEYRPLDIDVNEIRLITLLPSDDTGIVNYNFEHVSLINPPEFSALSYCWGDPDITKEIFINEKPIPVTTNLESALRHLVAKGYTRLWVDAICINQGDKAEKSQQLLWMGSIYRRAQEVVAWIGEEDLDSNAAIDFMESRGEFNSRDPLPTTNVDQIIKLVERPYWKRVWVIQEIAFARQTTIHCGQRRLSWSRFVSAIEQLERQEELSSSSIANARNLIRFHQEATINKPIHLLEALKRSFEALSTQPRDKVFALLGISYDSDLYLPVPNYKQSDAKICIGMTISITSTTFSLDFVVLLGSGVDNMWDLPTWCPNWFSLSKKSAMRPLSYLLGGAQNMPFRHGVEIGARHWAGHGENHYHQTGSNLLPNIRIKNEILFTAARFLHEIGSIYSNCNGINSIQSISPRRILEKYESKFQFTTMWWETLSRGQILPSFARSRASFATEIWDCCWNTPSNEFRSTKSWWDANIDIEYIRVRKLLHVFGALEVGHRTLLDRATQWTSQDADAIWEIFLGRLFDHWSKINSTIYWTLSSQIREMLEKITKALLDEEMLLFGTMDEKLGWAHVQACPGDKIFLIPGSSVPVVLREISEGNFKLVGDAWVYGEMYGEALEGVKDEDWVQLAIH